MSSKITALTVCIKQIDVPGREGGFISSGIADGPAKYCSYERVQST